MAQSKRRGRSRPGVYQRRGKWFYTLDVKDPATGTWRKKWSRAQATQTEAYEARVEALGRIQKGQWADPGRKTVGEYLEAWQAGRPVGFGLRATTANTYRYQLQWAMPRIGHIKLRDLEPSHLRSLYRELLAGGGKGGKALSVASVQGVHRCLHKAMQDAVEDGLLVRNPLDRVKRPTADHRREVACWEVADALKFLAAIREERLYAMWLVFLTTGMRRGEVAGLRWKDVNLDAGRIAVRNQRTCVNHEVVTNDPKTSASSGTIAIDREVAAALRLHQLRRKEERLKAGAGWEDSGYVFVEPDGRPYHPQRITRMFQALSRDAAVPKVRLHDLRHTCATLLIEAGVPLKVVQERLRHASFATTADLYAHVSATMQQEAAKTIEALLVAAGKDAPELAIAMDQSPSSTPVRSV